MPKPGLRGRWDLQDQESRKQELQTIKPNSVYQFSIQTFEIPKMFMMKTNKKNVTENLSPVFAICIV